MPSIELSYVNIALDSFGLIVSLIMFASGFGDLTRKKHGSRHFLFLLSFVMLALVADIVSWIGEGNVALRYLTLIANAMAACSGQLAIICFMGYLTNSLYGNSRAAVCILRIFQVLCVLSLLFAIGNIFGGYAFFVDETGHYVQSANTGMVILYLLFPLLSFLALILMALFATHSAKVNRFLFILYTLFPVAGIVADYLLHSLSLTYISLAVSVLVIYTGIFVQKQKLIEAQKQTLMLSQINPHFVYNTLSTIASMCDLSPKLAKSLTLDFSTYLRRNLDTLSGEDRIPFDKELEHVECYLKIEKARFRERLNVIYAIQCRDFFIPPLSVQPIVENAVRHGITKKASGGTLRISTYATDRHYIIEIRDDGVGFDTEQAPRTDGRAHVGLENVRNRIGGLCHGTLTVKSTVGVGTRVTIEIPKKGNTHEHTGD